MTNEMSYYERMSSTMNAKCKSLLPHLKEGSKVLDFGCGMDLSISKLVKEFNGEYTAVDNSKQVQLFFEENSINCFNSLDDIDEKYDVIYLSSVFHELLSFLSPLEVSELTRNLTKLLKDDGKIVIRDWNVMFDRDWNKFDSITINEDKLPEIQNWVSALKYNGIVEGYLGFDKLRFEDDTISGKRSDLYNVMYHTTWGLQSMKRESRENYVISYESILKYFYNNDLEIVSDETKWDDTYIQYMSKYFPGYATSAEAREDWIAPKKELILQKKESIK